ncbi:Gfo/Idh/MocA family oxidoreductase [Conexibacter sp. JD483]|uniref:Gfo/Idh/MocA family protein n=1 Tax=unclassified Conexibacter TaxID=2627773 RepID=UPI00271E83CA|nr:MULTISPECIES: Gfo/Idh/MocA family oxidoreductase [unclassified Conexibacter]MDO8187347.1 Gfo/Idh/MocA family oxidoreductase [Conexibacter sp. CPCC 205706]MDO8200520.1 Gfo/Idh/MocA family oxidoreductase [Conexibacter sp. CPCC 205762]MDR9370011.1 Gfo/Idh/MocA family oxidoreductase [Conexibacter sp. JD483]
MSANDYIRRIGLIGLGFAAWDLKLPSYAAIDGIELVAVADPSPAARERAQRELGIPAERCFADPYELLRSGLVDAVDVSTPHHTHADLLVAAAEAGVAAACDKPLAMSLEEADRIVAASERSGTPIGVFRNFAHFPSHAKMRELVEQGAIGRPSFARVSAIGVFAPDTTGANAKSWRLRSEVAGGGITIDYGIHAIYLARGLLGGAEIVRVSATIDRVDVQAGDVEDRVSMRLETADGAYATVDLTWGGGSTGDVTVFGSHGVLKIVHEGGISAPHNVARAVGHMTDRRDETLHELDWTRDPFDWYYRGAIETFLGQLDGRPGVTAADGRADLEIALAAYRSAALGGPIALPLDPADPVYRRGAAGVRELDLPADSVILRKRLFGGGAA